jgi:hypothetical protein
MTMVTSKHLEEYEALNGAVRNLKNPLFDEGFRMKRYKNDGTEHHAYHVDSGQEPSCSPRRNIAVLIYLNEVREGGETVQGSSRCIFYIFGKFTFIVSVHVCTYFPQVFYNHGMAVQPKCGRVLFFPTSFTYVHAGRRPVSNYKYVVANFIGA